MQLDATTRQYLKEKTGMAPLSTANGRMALSKALASDDAQVLVVEGDVARVKETLLRGAVSEAPAAAVASPPSAAPAMQLAENLQEKATRYLVHLLSAALKLPAQRIDPQAPMESYGIDSVLVIELTRTLEKTFGSLPKTLFYEYQTIASLTAYFLRNHHAALTELLGEQHAIPSMLAVPSTAGLSMPVAKPRKPRFPARHTTSEASEIAIIGLAGRYPKAANVQEFWANLSQGKDCIGEIPSDRWDYKLYFDPDRNASGKTYSKWGGFIDGVDHFDPLFFNISPREAELMDPQERLFLECVHAALEDAGYTRETVAGKNGNAGVFVGVMYGEYQLYGAQEQALGRQVALSSSSASIANRVSYFCNFNGPSMALDTMCSSSLTAIHLAVQSLQRGDCAVAVAGGVNVSIHPNKYLALAQGKFISAKGRCESFGEGGEGYVPGEGVGALLLKSKAQAIADGDHIYGVIKGSAVNHGGKTNGYTVPNPNAQADVIERALREARVDARSISYIEAHGTGTSLGDPIEIAGLSKAFAGWTAEKQFCAIGSAKSNIGHCESAAGIAGITKVLLQMKHGQLAPSLHSNTLNPNIDFADTPFIVQQELANWPRAVAADGGAQRELPLRAGISSFGAGGSNAHVVIEEYRSEDAQTAILNGPALVVLSARNEERLKEQAVQLLAAIEGDQRLALAELAYTLQVGREAMEERLAFATGSLDDLRVKLRSFIGGESLFGEVYRGQAKRNKEAYAALSDDEELALMIDGWLAKGKSGKVLDLWVKGLVLDWERLYDRGQLASRRPSRISLPTYPFAKQRYWVPAGAPRQAAASAVLHPLLHRNTSDIFGLQFSTRLSGDEFFLKDHKVEGASVLPGAAQLEMAYRAACEGLRMNGGLVLRNIVWTRPITVDAAGLEIHIALSPEDDGSVSYEIFDDADAVFSQGKVVASRQDASAPAPSHDLASLRQQCGGMQVGGKDCYAIFEQAGLHYGPSFQALKELLIGEQQVMAHISLPQLLAETSAAYVLHPSLLDAALQASVGMQLQAGGGQAMRLMLPFALGSLEVFAPCETEMWALLRFSPGSSARDAVQKLDIDLCSESGAVLASLRQFSLRALAGDPDPAPAEKKPQVEIAGPNGQAETLLLAPEWRMPPPVGGSAPDFARHVVLSCGTGGIDIGELQPHLAARFVAQTGDYAAAAGTLLEELQQLQRQPGPQLIQLLLPARADAHTLCGLEGMLRSARLENPRMTWQTIRADEAGEALSALADGRRRGVAELRYTKGQPQVRTWRELRQQSNTPAFWKPHGVYLITGGAGGLGLIVARDIARQAQHPVLILTGRSALQTPLQQAMRELEALGAVVHYRQLDVADADAVTLLVQQIPEEFESLDGIIHSAGTVRDALLARKTPEQLHEVLSAKVAGTINLDQASRDIQLDCFICFSSLAGALGNVGQADYAAANAFMDAFAHSRSALAALGQRHGCTLSLNWPLWEQGGMQVDARQREAMLKNFGMRPLETEQGLQALHQALASGLEQVLVLAGDGILLRKTVLGMADTEVISSNSQIAAIAAADPN
ncbi:type I polyketide synthase [Massilia sp. MB5]|uniref:type I polyketide synthase n=1 Tax=Massilia sp. MB5 TaxID=2919578 RepID=UPI001F119188|nr:type I polyketide synthase [Massilia sp. MB5]UMR29381.1 type I polyketide synthase [Massilia sp. MB5]